MSHCYSTKGRLFSLYFVVLSGLFAVSSTANAWVIPGAHNDGPRTCQDLQGAAWTVASSGAMVTSPNQFAFDTAAYALNIALKLCPPQIGAPENKWFYPDGGAAATGASSCQKTFTSRPIRQQWESIYSIDIKGIDYDVWLPGWSGTVPDPTQWLGAPDVYTFNGEVDLRIHSINGLLQSDRLPFNAGAYDDEVVITLPVGFNNEIVYRASSIVSAFDLTPVYVLFAPSGMPGRKTLVKGSTKMIQAFKPTFKTLGPKMELLFDGLSVVGPTTLAALAEGNYFTGRRISEYIDAPTHFVNGVFDPNGEYNLVDEEWTADVFNDDTQLIRIVDTVDPEIFFLDPPAELDHLMSRSGNTYYLEALGPTGISKADAMSYLSQVVSGSDTCDRSVNISSSGAILSSPEWDINLPVETPAPYSINWTVSDLGPADGETGGVNSVSQLMDVVVRDTKPPIVLAPAGKVVDSAGATTNVALGSPRVFDLVDLDILPTASTTTAGVTIANGEADFPDGWHTVQWDAQDDSGNVATAGKQLVIVKDVSSNIDPVALSQPTVNTITYEPVEIILRGHGGDVYPVSSGEAGYDASLEGRHEPVIYDIVTAPAHGTFVKDPEPYFIEDARLYSGAAQFAGNWQQVYPQAYCEPPVEHLGTWEMEYPYKAVWMTVNDKQNDDPSDDEVVVMDNGSIDCNVDAFEEKPRLAKFGYVDGKLTYLASSGPITQWDGNAPSADSFFWDNQSGYIFFSDDPDLGFPFVHIYDENLNTIPNEFINMESYATGGPGSTTRSINGIVADDANKLLYLLAQDRNDGDLMKVMVYDITDPNNSDYVGAIDIYNDITASTSQVTSMDLDSEGNLYLAVNRESNYARIYKYSPSVNNAGTLVPGALIGWMGKCDSTNLVATGGAYHCSDDIDTALLPASDRHSYGFLCTDATCNVANYGAVSGLSQFSAASGNKIDISFSPDDILYVAETSLDRVQRFSKDGLFAGQARSAGKGNGFVLGDFGDITYVEVNRDYFYVLDTSLDLLFSYKTTPLTPIDEDEDGWIDGAKVIYQSNGDFPHPSAPGDTEDTFEFITYDGLAISTPTTITVDVSRNYRKPVLDNSAPVNLVVNEDDAGGVVHNFSAQVSDVLDVFDTQFSGRLVAAPEHGTVTFGANDSTLTYVPDADYEGTDSFSFRADDLSDADANGFPGMDVSDEVQTVSVTVNPVDDLPVLTTAESSVDVLLGYDFKFSFGYFDPDILQAADTVSLTIDWGDGTTSTSGEMLIQDVSVNTLTEMGVQFVSQNDNSMDLIYPSDFPDDFPNGGDSFAGQTVNVPASEISSTGPVLNIDENGNGTLVAQHAYTGKDGIGSSTEVSSYQISICVDQVMALYTDVICAASKIPVTTVNLQKKLALSADITADQEWLLVGNNDLSNQLQYTIRARDYDIDDSDPRHADLPLPGPEYIAPNVLSIIELDTDLIIDNVTPHAGVCNLSNFELNCDYQSTLFYGETAGAPTVTIDVRVPAKTVNNTVMVTSVKSTPNSIWPDPETELNSFGTALLFTVERDSDSDGVKDNDDAFPYIAGAIADSDGDGIADIYDDYPNDPDRSSGDSVSGGPYPATGSYDRNDTEVIIDLAVLAHQQLEVSYQLSGNNWTGGSDIEVYLDMDGMGDQSDAMLLDTVNQNALDAGTPGVFNATHTVDHTALNARLIFKSYLVSAQASWVIDNVNLHWDPTDADDDGVIDAEDELPMDASSSADADGDNVADEIDNCLNDFNFYQVDTDGDGEGNVCDWDDDGDGVPDVIDPDVLEALPLPLDATYRGGLLYQTSD